MEEGVLGARLALPLLYVVDDEHVDGLVEEDEVVDGLAHHGIGVLYLKESCAHIEHALLGVFVAHVYADGIDEVSLSTARGTVDKHGVELAVVGVLGYRLSYRPWQLVAGSLDVVVERLPRVEPWVESLRPLRFAALRLHHALALGLSGWGSLHLRLHHRRFAYLIVLRFCYKVLQLCMLTKDLAQHMAEKFYIIAFEIFTDIATCHLDSNRPLCLLVMEEDQRFEPRSILLGGYTVAYQRKNLFPTGVRSHFHLRNNLVVSLSLAIIFYSSSRY